MTAAVHDGDSAVLNLGVDFESVHLLGLLTFLVAVTVALFIVVFEANTRELERLALDFLNVAQLVEVHVAERNGLVTLLNLPRKAHAIENLQESLIIVGQLEWAVLFLPVRYGHLSDAAALNEFNVGDTDVVLEEANNVQTDDVENVSN